jgi:hypothetical protein
VLDFGICSPPDFAAEAQWSRKDPQMGPRIGFGAKKKLRQWMPFKTNWEHFGAFLFFHLDTTKLGLPKGLCSAP